jgi:amino acid adenylation domain-containing protein
MHDVEHLRLAPLTVPGPQRSLAGRWSAVASELPDRTAIHSPEGTYTFAQADAAAERVARAVQHRLPADDSPVALFVDNSAVALVGILSLLKLGRVLVILDRHQPADRLRQVVELAGSTCCLADTANIEAARSLGGGLTAVHELAELAAADVGDEPPLPPPAGGPTPVSVVFTSGSTGRPKGVAQTHEQFLNEAAAKGKRFELTPSDRVGVLLPFGFAAGFSALMAALLNGAGVWVFEPRDRGVAPFAEWVSRHRITAVHCTPHLMRSLAAVLPPGTRLETLRYVCTLGEPVFARDVAGVRSFLAPTGSFYNETGSSEMGTLAIKRIRSTDPLPDGQVPAGPAIDNKEVRILRSDGTPAAVGEAGDIMVVSDYLSGGYWRDPEATAARFGVTDDGRRMIRQGDLGRIDADGELMMLGRSDAAVKIRGYLVEPSEIEAAILASGGVLETVVQAVTDPPAPTRLVAYVVPDPGVRTESPAALRRRLRARLPEYMVPAVVVALARLPRNERGKVDRRALPPAPDRESSERPSGQWELVLADIWERVLGLDQIGLDEDFMALGGDSLTVEEMLAAVRESVGVELVSTDLLAAPTLREFSARVRQGSAPLPRLPDVVLLQPDGGETPLFCFAGSGGLALSFRPLSRYFPDRRVYSFQAHGLERRAVPDWSVEKAAVRYLEFIRAVRPHGPYLLLGHSFGGLVALDVARRLTETGETVDLVTVLDTYLPRSSGVLPVAVAPPAVSAAGDRGAGFPLTRALRRFLSPGGTPLWVNLPFRMVRRLRALSAGIIRFEGQRLFDAFFDQGVIVSGRYKLRPYAGRTLMMFAENNPNGPTEWEPLLTGPHRFSNVRSEHTSMLRDPHVADVAAEVRRALSTSPWGTSPLPPNITADHGTITGNGRNDSAPA